MKKCYFISLQAMLAFTYAQVGINTNSPNAMLEIASKPDDLSVVDGLIPPKLDGEVLKSKDDLYETDQLGTIIYVTEPITSSTPKTVNVTSKGHYYYDGLAWQKLKSSSDITENIFTTDNALTESRVINLDDKTLSFNSTAKNGTDHFRVDEQTFNVDAVNHRVGVGTNAPSTKLDVDGNLRITNVEESTDPSDATLVVDNDGTVKKQVLARKIVINSYLENDIEPGIITSLRIYKIKNLNIISNSVINFKPEDGRFTVLDSGLYKVTYSLTATHLFNSSLPKNIVFGISRGLSEWVMRSTILIHNIPFDSKTGATFSFTGVASLREGLTYYFGSTYRMRYLAKAEGVVGDSPNSYLKLELIKKE